MEGWVGGWEVWLSGRGISRGRASWHESVLGRPAGLVEWFLVFLHRGNAALVVSMVCRLAWSQLSHNRLYSYCMIVLIQLRLRSSRTLVRRSPVNTSHLLGFQNRNAVRDCAAFLNDFSYTFGLCGAVSTLTSHN